MYIQKIKFYTSEELKKYCKKNGLEIISKNAEGKMRDHGIVFDSYKLNDDSYHYIRCGR